MVTCWQTSAIGNQGVSITDYDPVVCMNQEHYDKYGQSYFLCPFYLNTDPSYFYCCGTEDEWDDECCAEETTYSSNDGDSQ